MNLGGKTLLNEAWLTSMRRISAIGRLWNAVNIRLK